MASNLIAQALALAAQGHIPPAIQLLEAAGEAGNSQAYMQLAVWHLLGAVVPRDLERARALLRRAVAIGHVDGALMEIALTANGNGSASATDWATAHALLEIATKGDAVAAAQLELLRQMDLRADGTPQSVPEAQQLHQSPRVLRYPGFLTSQECAHIATTGSELLEPSQIIDPRSGRLVPNPIRTSDGGAIGPVREDLVVRAINLRIAAISDTAVEQGESLTVLRYRPGQQYRRHLDTIAGAANQRICTVLLYLNQGFGGGETRFPLLDLTIHPKGGDAIVFDTTLPDGSPDDRAAHTGEPVTAGVKWLATRWIRAAPVDPWTVAAG